jgi:hypothetical protein
VGYSTSVRVDIEIPGLKEVGVDTEPIALVAGELAPILLLVCILVSADVSVVTRTPEVVVEAVVVGVEVVVGE